MIEEEGLPFPGPEFTSVESGPSPFPKIVENQAIFVSRAQREGIQVGFLSRFLGQSIP